MSVSTLVDLAGDRLRCHPSGIRLAALAQAEHAVPSEPTIIVEFGRSTRASHFSTDDGQLPRPRNTLPAFFATAFEIEDISVF